MKFEISRHARNEMNRRGIPENLIHAILKNPEQILDEYGNMKAYQSIIGSETGKNYLVRIIVNCSVEPKKIVTVYKTSKVSKYWRQP